MQSAHHQLTMHNEKLHYWTYGDKTKPIVIMVHGFRGTHHGFEKIAEALPDFYCVVPDLPGFGESSAFTNRQHSLANYVEFLKEFKETVEQAEPSFIIGHSFGSIVASHFAASYPSLVKKLVLINPISAPALKGPQKIPTRLAIGYYWVAKNLPKKASNRVLSSRLIVDVMSNQMTISKNKRLRAYIYDQHRKHFSTFASPKVVAEAFTTSISHTTTDVVEQLTMPTMVLAAENDQISSITSQQAFAKRLSDGKLHVVKNVGHLVHYEKATEAAAAIDEFLKK